MSHTTLYSYHKDSVGFHEVRSFKNAWGGAAFVWRVLAVKYDAELQKIPKGIDEDPDPFGWASVIKYHNMKDNKLEPWERNVLLTTYDRAVIPAEQAALLAASLRTFEERNRHFSPQSVCSLRDQADAIEEAAKDPTCLWFAWEQTSVSGFWGASTYNEELGEDIPFDLEAFEAKNIYPLEPLE